LEIDWEDFEKLCLKVASVIDGLEDPRLFGERGESQAGIDFWGWVGKKPVVYQVRRLETEPTGGSLKKAFLDFKSKGSDLGSKSFTLCTARSAKNARLQKMLAKLRSDYPEFQIDVYDGHKLAEVLRNAPDLVFQFFGPSWPESFCGIKPSFATSGPNQPAPAELTEAALIGPIRSLGLALQLSEAERSEDKTRAAAEYGHIADQLRAHAFGGHADRFEERQATALLESGQLDAAFAIWLDIVIRDVDDGLLLGPGPTHRMREVAGQVSRELQLRHQAVVGRELWRDQSQAGLDQMVSAFVELEGSLSPGAGHVGLWIAECALTDQKLGILEEFAERLERAAQGLSGMSRIRTRLALAELRAEWGVLIRQAETGELGAAEGGIVLSRFGRWLAWNARPEDARDAYRKAIPMLIRAELLGDASEALDSIGSILSRYGPMEEMSETHAMARAFDGRHLLLPRDPLPSALEALRTADLPDAHARLREYLLQSTISGHLRAELYGRELMADVLERGNEFGIATGNYMLAGNRDAAARIAEASEAHMNLDLENAPNAPWALATQLAVLSANGDLVPEETARSVFPMLLRYRLGVRQSHFGPRVSTEADNALAAISPQLARDQIETLLDVYEPLIDRSADQWRPTDESIVRVLIVAYQLHPGLRGRAFEDLVACLGQFHIGGEAINVLSGFISHTPPLARTVRTKAEAANHDALVTLAFAGIKHDLVRQEARQRYRRVMDIRPPAAGQPIAMLEAFEIDSIFVRQLPLQQRNRFARKLMTIAHDTAYFTPHRASALGGLLNIASTLELATRSELLRWVLAGYADHGGKAHLDEVIAGARHALSRFRFNLGEDDIPIDRISVAASLSTEARSAKTIVELIMPFLFGQNSRAIRLALRAYLRLEPSIRPPVDLTAHAYHPDPDVRSDVVTHLCQLPVVPEALIERLAADPSRKVRFAVATNIWRLSANAPLGDRHRASLLTDPSAQVRIAASGRLDPPHAERVTQPQGRIRERSHRGSHLPASRSRTKSRSDAKVSRTRPASNRVRP
jgi:hypothetical protein